MKNKFSKWDVGGGSRSIVQGLNLFTSRNLFKSLKSILMIVALLSLSSNVWGAEKTIKFTPNAATTGSTATSYGTVNCIISEVGWTFNQYNPSNLQIKTNQSSVTSEFYFKNTSALPGKIKSVVITFSALTVSDASKLCFVGGTSTISSLSGGSAGTWNSTAKTLTWTPAATTNFTYFAFYQNGKAASGTNKLATSDAIVITYEEGSSTTYYLAGSMNDWSTTADQFTGTPLSVTKNLSANTSYTFKVATNGTWDTSYGKNYTINRQYCTDITLDGSDNVTLQTDKAGDYTFNITINGSGNPVVSVVYPPDTWQLAGFNDWGNKIDFVNGSCQVNLTAKTYTAATDAGFKLIKNGTTYYGCNGTMTRSSCTDWTFYDGAGNNNCGITADEAGTYTFTINTSGADPRLTVTYPVASLKSIAEVIGATTSTENTLTVTMNNWVITAVSGHQFYITDGTLNGMLCYLSGHGFTAGDHLSGTIEVKSKVYNQQPEFTSLKKGMTGLTTTSGSLPTPIEVTDLATVNQVENQGILISFKNAPYNADGYFEYDEYDNFINYEDKFNTGVEPQGGLNYDVTGLVCATYYSSTLYLNVAPLKAADIQEVVAKYDASFANGGHGIAPAVQSQVSSVTLAAITGVTGWTNDYWTADVAVKDGSNNTIAAGTHLNNGTTYKLTANTTFTAHWQVNSHTLTWNFAGGSTTSSSSDYTHGSVNYGATITAPADPTKANKKFDGWMLNSEVVTPATTMPDNNLTYVAKWVDIVWTDYLTDCSAPDTWFLFIDGETEKSGEMVDFTKTVELEGNRNYGFKLYKNIEGDPTNQVWYTDGTGAQDPGTITVDNCSGWNFKNTTPASGNTGIRTTATGNYTFSFEIVDGYPRVSVTYPTAYQVSYEANGGTGTMNPSDYCAAGEDVALPAPTFTMDNWNCIGWTADVNVTVNGETVTAGSFIPKTAATIQNINSDITLTAVWERLVITQADEKYQVYVDGTLQLTLTAYYSPNITTGAPYTWTTSNSIYATVDEDGLVTGKQPINTGEYVRVTSNFGTESNHYDIEVISAACTGWGLHYWNGEPGQIGNKCFDIQIGDHEYRTTEFVLPSASASERVQVLKNGASQDHTQDWAANQIPMIGQQLKECGWSEGDNKREYYAGQDAVGYLRIYDDSGSDNYYLAFQPTYVFVYGENITKDSKENQIEFHYTGKVGTEYADYETNFVQLPADYATNANQKFYVGTKRTLSSSQSPFIHDGKSVVTPIKDMRNISGDQTLGGKWGVYQMYDNSCDANFWVGFIRYCRLHYDLDGGAGTGDYTDKFALPSASAEFTLETAPTKEGYTFLGWSVNSTTKQPGARVTLSDDVTATAIWAQNYTVTYDLAGYSTSCSGATTHYCGETVTVCEAPEAVTGYTFGGWKTTYKINDDYGAGAVLEPGTPFVMPCERVVDVVFTAKLTANQYNIIYKDQNNAEFSGRHETDHPTKHTYDTETTLMGATKTGYEFGGWYKDAACEGAVVTTLGATEYTANITLYAKWTVNSYHATLNANGGTGEGGFDFTFGQTNVDNFTSTIARAGYDLNGFWSATSNGTQILNNDGTRTADKYHSEWITEAAGWVKADNDGVLYAHWTAKSGIPYNIEYYLMDLNGNYPATATEIDAHTGTAGQAASHTQKEYTGFEKPIKQETTIAGDGSTVVKYYYVRHQHEFAWEFNDGVTSGDYTPANPTMYYGAPITYPAIAKEGYAFLGWSYTETTMPDADLTITAQWAKYTNYRTYCGDAVTFYAQNGSDPEEEFVITTDNGKITAPTLVETGFTRPEGWVLIGWTKVGDDTHTIVELGKANVAVEDDDEYNAVWTHIAITGNVLTTSAVGVQVGTTIHVEGTTNNAYGLRVSFVDTKGTDDTSDDVTYGSATGQTAVAQSDFRLANTSYTYIDGSIIRLEGTAAGDTHSSDYNVVYTPLTANEIDNYVLQIQVMKTSATALDGALYTLNLKGRALTDNFVIAEYLNDKWYALPADMNGSNTYAGKEITVEGEGKNRVVTNATLDRVYSMKTYNFDRSHVLFQSQFNQGHLWAATGTETGINDYAKTVTGESPAYSWMPTPQGATLDTYVMSNVNNTKTLVLNSDLKFGMYAKASTNTNIVYFIPLKAEEYVEKEMMMVEWFPTKVLVEVDEDALTDVRAKINNVEVADVTASDTKYGTHLYEITGLNTLVDNAAKELTILYTKEETTYGYKFDIPVIVSNKTYILSSSKAENKFPWTQAVYNTADLVVRDNSVLTVDGATNTANTFGNVTIYPNSKVVVPAQASEMEVTMTTTTMTLFGGTDEIYNGSEYTLTKYGVPQLVLNGKLVHNETTSGLVYDVRLDAAQYYNFALPYTSKYELVTDNKGGEDFTFWTKVYDGATRAAGNNGWVWYNWNADPWAINIGTGYMFAAQPNDGQNYIIIRHPMGYDATENADGHRTSTAEATNAAVNVYAYPSTYPNNAGWNYIANPFMANFSKDLGDGCTGIIQTGQLVEHKVNEKWDGHYKWEAESMTVRYVTLYDNGSDTYEQLPMSTAVLAPFTGFFVQMAEGGQIVFDISGRTNSAPARMLSEDELPSEMEIFLHATCQGQKDDAVLFINDNLHRDNAKEFPNEMTKQENANTLNFYTFGGDDVKMYANGMSYEDAQGWSKAGVKVATAGEYTFSVASDQADYIQQVILRDMDSNTEYDLMSNDAKIYLDKGEMNDRFYVKIVFGKHNIGTGVTERYDTSAPEKFILNDHMYIRANGVLFDGVGKRVKY